MIPQEAKDLAADERWALTTRVVESRYLEKAVHLRELLLYLARKAIADPSAGVTEQQIGTQVLGRRPDYDPQADNIVRVQIRHLRQKLDQYFLTDGQNEPVVISIPKGSHVLRFEPRPNGHPAVAPPPQPPPEPAPPPRFSKWWWLATAALVCGAFFLGRLTDRAAGPTAESNEVRNALWARVFQKDQPTTIVIADSSLVIVQNVLQKSFTLSEYIDRSYRDVIEAVPNKELRDALRTVAQRQYTSLADATVSGELRSMGLRMGARVLVRYARHMHVRDFNTGNFILIGSSHSVPWVELFEPNLGFHFERIGNEQVFGFRNLRPQKGESPVYVSSTPASGPQESFATVSLLPNLARTGNVLMLTGVTMEATEAAGEFSMRSDFPETVAKTLGVPGAQRLPYFEILLKSISMAGAPHKADVVAWRKPGV